MAGVESLKTVAEPPRGGASPSPRCGTKAAFDLEKVHNTFAMKVLVATASTNLQQLIGRLLGRCGYQTEPVASAEAAIIAARSTAYQAIVSDMQLPDLCGTTLVDRLRRAGVDTPAILLAEEETPRLRRMADSLSATRFVAAADPEKLKDALERARSDAAGLCGHNESALPLVVLRAGSDQVE